MMATYKDIKRKVKQGQSQLLYYCQLLIIGLSIVKSNKNTKFKS